MTEAIVAPSNGRRAHLIVLSVAAILLGATSCSQKEPSDEEMLRRDRERLDEELNGVLLDQYKFMKTCLRVMPVLDTTIEEHRRIKDLMERTLGGRFGDAPGQVTPTPEPSAAEMLKEAAGFLSAYMELRSFVREHDEDEFPTILEGMAMANGDSVRSVVDGRSVMLRPPLTGEAKEHLNSVEHILAGVFLMLDRTQSFTKQMLLYECAKSRMEVLEGGDQKVLMQDVRGMLFHDQGFLYLAEKEYSDNLDWLHRNPDADLPMSSTILLWAPLVTGTVTQRPVVLTQDAAHQMQLLFNHAERALVRSSMQRKVDEERMMEDLEGVLNTARAAGVDNELVWSVEAYVHLKAGKTEEAAKALKRLRESEFIGTAERGTIDEAVGYLEERDPERALNGVYDRAFMGSLIAGYLRAYAMQQDWPAILVKTGLLRDAGIAGTVHDIAGLLEQVEKEAGTDALKAKGEELKQKGAEALKELLN